MAFRDTIFSITHVSNQNQNHMYHSLHEYQLKDCQPNIRELAFGNGVKLTKFGRFGQDTREHWCCSSSFLPKTSPPLSKVAKMAGGLGEGRMPNCPSARPSPRSLRPALCFSAVSSA